MMAGAEEPATLGGLFRARPMLRSSFQETQGWSRVARGKECSESAQMVLTVEQLSCWLADDELWGKRGSLSSVCMRADEQTGGSASLIILDNRSHILKAPRLVEDPCPFFFFLQS